MVHVQRMENALQLLQDHQAQIDQLTREIQNMKTRSEVTPVGGTVTYCKPNRKWNPAGRWHLHVPAITTFWKESTLYQRFSSITQ